MMWIAWAGLWAHLPSATLRREGFALLEEAGCCPAGSTAVNGWLIFPLSWRPCRHRTCWAASWLLTALLRKGLTLAGSCRHWGPNGAPLDKTGMHPGASQGTAEGSQRAFVHSLWAHNGYLGGPQGTCLTGSLAEFRE